MKENKDADDYCDRNYIEAVNEYKMQTDGELGDGGGEMMVRKQNSSGQFYLT